MAKAKAELEREPTKRELQNQLAKTRESLAETVGEIKDTVEGQYESVKHTVSGVLDYREQFKNEPMVWSLGALSAGFALGYTLGYAHKNTGRGKHSQLVAFADSMVDELSAVGQTMVMPALNLKIKELFGFNFSELLADMAGAKSKKRKSGKSKPKRLKASAKKRAGGRRIQKA